MMNHLPAAMSSPPLDPKDPRIRVTFPDVAMKVVQDGPMYGVLILVAVLSMHHSIETIHGLVITAFALQARSRPPEGTDKADKLIRGIIGGGAVLAIAGGGLSACL